MSEVVEVREADALIVNGKIVGLRRCSIGICRRVADVDENGTVLPHRARGTFNQCEASGAQVELVP
ncbi:hypothetical protein [Streptomyces indicus]|uniref:hypothetical protein n=1 Tax=Streptomyces indicus TaxID=417292 RepID=UPI00115F87B3|nr:hypothetical protein [Streptomyces indicus]